LPSADFKEVTPESVLVTRVRSGDEKAMAELYDRLSPVVYGIALRVLGNTDAAEDILQEVFLQLWRTPDAFDPARGSLAAWLAMISRNRALDALRKRRPQVDIDDVDVAVETDFADAAEKGRFLGRIRGALERIPVPQRSALEMAFFEGLTHTEIARKTGDPVGTVKTRIRTAVLSLREALSV
jgi:RNA polymerase sigma-70 factor (ECF subfamily)